MRFSFLSILLVVEIKRFMSGSTFDELLTGSTLAIAKKMYKAPTEIQKEVIPIAVAGKDIVAMSKTGSGKTAAFLFPMIEKLVEHSKITGCRGVIVSPTRELALQTGNFFKQYSANTNLKYASLIGGEPLPPQFDALTENPDVIICTPGRLLQIVAETSYSLSRVDYVVIDEADQLFEQGLGDQLSGILQLLPKKRQILLFSATIPQLLAEFTAANLKDPYVVRLDISQLPDTLKLQFLVVNPVYKPALLCRTIKDYKSSLVFVGTRHHAEFLSALMTDMGIKSACIYGQMDQDERNSSLAAFARGSRKVLFVTDVAARGIDIEGLDLVVNYDFPPKPKIFLHRSGRAGRAGRSGEVISFVTQDELPYYVGARESLNGQDWVITRVSMEEIQNELTQCDDALKRSNDLTVLRKGMEDGEKMYVTSRPKAKPYWLTLAKELNIEASGSKIEDAIMNWRPKATIFEQVPKSQKQLDIMKELKSAHEGHKTVEIKERREAQAREEEEAFQERVKKAEEQAAAVPKTKRKERPAKVRPKEEKDKEKTNEFFLDPSKYLNDTGSVREYGASSLQNKVLDLCPEDRTGFLLQKNLKKLGKKDKKEKLLRELEINKQAFIRHAVSSLTEVTPKGEKYQEWVAHSRKHIQSVGEEEKIVKTSKKKGGFGKVPKIGAVKSELKTPEQIERDRLIKLKHKLNDQGRHKEAAQLNQKIYKHKKKGRK
ncbi:DEAD/DEAH box helicase family protein [Tritrichomonas foetus]|uniref:DEAD/DEAH box helicase family protein n=1 Tax=Tritrichomonas foetus TaxID=1144522 RepID=A0A1J4KT70_9EUKA|nr:DEAD/DEAH box helicase family protein [Tritrichomonas foetus]|eukprot:OHT14487.1 DEAD/DEAH box helicase family protein [Tritrichomonas foetus]